MTRYSLSRWLPWCALVFAACADELPDQPGDAAGVRDAGTRRDARQPTDGAPDSDADAIDTLGTPDSGARDSGTAGCAGTWSSPVSLVDQFGRLAVGNQVHVVGHSGGQLVHRTSTDDGVSWSAAKVIAPAAGNVPGMYGGLYSEGDNVYLVTAPADMASSASVGGRQLDFRRSTSNGASWTSPIRITKPGQSVFRVRVAANGKYVHVVSAGAPTPEGSVLYFRSTDGGATWDTPVVLASNLGVYGGGQTVAVAGAVVHVAYTTAKNGAGGGPTSYLRSTDNGSTWSSPVLIGENSAESSRQARVQLAAASGYVFASWQREGAFTGATLPPDRIGYNTSSNGGATWGVAKVLPDGSGINRNHQQVWMAPSGGGPLALAHR